MPDTPKFPSSVSNRTLNNYEILLEEYKKKLDNLWSAYKNLYDQGKITEDEFNDLKKADLEGTQNYNIGKRWLNWQRQNLEPKRNSKQN